MKPKHSPPTEPWRIHFFQRHKNDDPSQSVPGREFLDACPDDIAAKFADVLKAVAEAPPPKFAGRGKWEAMHGEMKGFYEVRIDGPKRRHYRLFCILEQKGGECGLGGPSLVIIAGAAKDFRTKLADKVYAKVRSLGKEYRSRSPRSIL